MSRINYVRVNEIKTKQYAELILLLVLAKEIICVKVHGMLNTAC